MSAAITTETIVNGDRSIVTVPQGCVGYCTDRGQPVLLPPGMHQWQSPTLKFQTLIDLNKPVIPLGPWTLLTIDQGYMAVTQDNGRQIILNGGSVYLLTHRVSARLCGRFKDGCPNLGRVCSRGKSCAHNVGRKMYRRIGNLRSSSRLKFKRINWNEMKLRVRTM